MRTVDVAVVGGGPAGQAAARRAAELGLETLLIDEQPIAPADAARNIPYWFGSRGGGRRLTADQVGRWLERQAGLQAAAAAGAEVLTGHVVFGAFAETTLGISDGHAAWPIQARQVILAPGATDLHLAFPGWTLGGVCGALGALSLLETYGHLDGGQRLAILGTGQLGQAVAQRARAAGLEVVALLDPPAAPDHLATRVRPASPPSRGSAASPGGDMSVGAAASLRAAPGLAGDATPGDDTSPDREGRRASDQPLVAIGPAEVTRLRLQPPRPGAAAVDVAVDTVVVAIGRQPAIELAALFGCALHFAAAAAGWVVAVDAWQRTTVPHILAAGDICGAPDATFTTPDLAAAQGARAALTAAAALGRGPTLGPPPLTPDPAAPPPSPHTPILTHWPVRSAPAALDPPPPTAPPSTPAPPAGPFLTPWHARAEQAADDDLVICRCEEVTRAAVLAALDLVGPDLDDVKRLSRAGMGLCQGRGCRPLVASLVAAQTGRSLADLPPTTYRPPVRPLSVAALATEAPADRELPVFVTRRIAAP
jgi:thioredoxin reductase